MPVVGVGVGIGFLQYGQVAGPADHYLIVAPASADQGTPFNITVSIYDSVGIIVTGYTGTVAFSSSDPIANLPGNSTLTSGTGIFSVTLEAGGLTTITATDTTTPSITGNATVNDTAVLWNSTTVLWNSTTVEW